MGKVKRVGARSIQSVRAYEAMCILAKAHEPLDLPRVVAGKDKAKSLVYFQKVCKRLMRLGLLDKEVGKHVYIRTSEGDALISQLAGRG